MQLLQPLLEILAFLVLLGDATFKLANLLMILFCVVFFQLALLFRQLLVEGVLGRLDLLLEQNNLRLEVDDYLFLVSHVIMVLLLKMVNNILL